jgi:hypothetical protein
VRHDVFARPELLEDLEALGLFHDHALAVVIDVTNSDDEAIRHPTHELALLGRERHDLLTPGVRAFADELDEILV